MAEAEKLGIQMMQELLQEIHQNVAVCRAEGTETARKVAGMLAPSATPPKEEHREENLGHLLRDVRDSITDASRLMQSYTQDVLKRLDDLLAPQLMPQAPSMGHQWHDRVHCWGGWVLAGGLLLGVAWGYSSMQRYVQLAQQLDAVLVTRATTLPPLVQQDITAVYTQAGFASPAQRQKGAAR